MDYSTISNKTNVTAAEEELTGGELSEKYYLLRKQYDNLSRNYDNIKQELHDTRRCYQTALDVQSHLSSELESYQADENKRKCEFTNRISSLQEEITTLRKERIEIEERYAVDIKNLENENRRIKDEQVAMTPQSPERDNSELDETRAALSSVTSELAATKEAVEEARSEIASWRLKVEELVTEIGELRAAAEIRKEEMNVIVEREAAAIADLTEMRAILHQVDSQEQQPHAAKGNSIFAEVEDKRQEMAKNLIQMKQSNSRLRRDLANKQAELDTLLHEKQTIWEQQAGATAHYDKQLLESYEERITQLEGACEKQRRELCRWFSRLQESSPGWLPAVLEHLMTECEQLRAEVLSRGAAQLASSVQVRELRRKLAQASATTISNATSKQSPVSNEDNVNVQKYVPIKRPIEDVKKKVSFN